MAPMMKLHMIIDDPDMLLSAPSATERVRVDGRVGIVSHSATMAAMAITTGTIHANSCSRRRLAAARRAFSADARMAMR